MSDTGRPGPERPAVPPISNWQATQAPTPTAPTATTPTTPTTGRRAAAADPTEPPTEQAPASGRPAWLIPAIIGAVVVIAAAIIFAIVNSSGGDDETPAVATTVLLPSPTPTVEPAARPATTAFAVALPPTVLQYALATSAPDAEWQAAGAIEAYTETYTDGGSGTVTVRAGQWETPEEASAFAAALVAALPTAPAPDPSASPSSPPTGPALPQSGEVSAAGAAVGTYSIADAGDGTGIAVWTNGTTVFHATAPVADVVTFYNAFPL